MVVATCKSRWKVGLPASLVLFMTGCAAFHPLDGIPAECLAPELNQSYRSCQQTIDLSLLRQTPPKDYRVDTGDVLAVYIQGVLGGGEKTDTPPTNFQQTLQYNSSAGFPIHVRGDGTISLPLVKPVNVRGLTITEVEDQLRKTYIDDSKILKSGQETILVSLQQPRTVRVLVLREERVSTRHNSNTTYGSNGDIETGRRGQVVDLSAYDNDVLHALTKTGGLPALEAEDAVYIVRKQGEPTPAPMNAVPHAMEQTPWLNSHQRNSEGSAAHGSIEADRAPHAEWPAEEVAKTNEEWWKTTQPSLHDRVREFWALPSERRKKSVRAAGGADAPWAEKNNWGSASKSDSRRSQSVAQTSSSDAVTDAWWNASNASGEETTQVQESREFVGPITEYSDGATIRNPRVTRIPIRITPGEMPCFTEQDVILHDGDVVYIEAREQEFFYTSGLLGGGQYAIPRDYDLDVLGALSIVQSQVNTQHHSAARNVGGMSVLNQDVSVGASELIIRRKMADHTVVNIKVDLKKAIRSPENKIFIQPGDYIVLQYTKCEACGAFVQRYLLEPFVIGTSSGAFFGN